MTGETQKIGHDVCRETPKGYSSPRKSKGKRLIPPDSDALRHSLYPTIRVDDDHCIVWMESGKTKDGCLHVPLMATEINECDEFILFGRYGRQFVLLEMG